MKQKETILITGGCGYIGSHMGYVLAGYGYDVILLDRIVSEQAQNWQWATIIKADYGDSAILEKLFTTQNIAAVMHCASSISVPESVENPLDYYENNVSKTVILLRQMVKHNINKLIFSSSCAVYGNPHIVPVTEQHPLNPASPYGTTKMMIETIIKDTAHVHDLQFVNLRYFNVAGRIPGLYQGPQQGGNVIPLLLHAALTGAPFYLFGTDYQTPDGSCVRDYVHVHDIALGHYKALQHLEHNLPSDTFNLGSGAGFSVKDIITATQNCTQKEINVIPAGRRQGDPELLIASIEKATNLLAWRPCYSTVDYCVSTGLY